MSAQLLSYLSAGKQIRSAVPRSLAPMSSPASLIAAHDALSTAHAVAFATHDALSSAHSVAFSVHDGLSGAHSAAFSSHNSLTGAHAAAFATHDALANAHSAAFGTHVALADPHTQYRQKSVAIPWSDIQGPPSSFTPALHASSHANGGSDQIGIATSQIISGQIAPARGGLGADFSTLAIGALLFGSAVGVFSSLAPPANTGARWSLTAPGGSNAPTWSDKACWLDQAQTILAGRTIQAAAGLTVLNAATQDAIQLLGRAGGSGSYAATITPAALTGPVTWTLPARNDTFAGLGAQTFTGLQTFSNGLNVTNGTITLPGIATLGANTFVNLQTLNAGLTLTAGSLTLPAASISDAALSANIPRKNAASTFSALQTFSAGLTVSAGSVVLPTASIADSALSSNVGLLNANQFWFGIQNIVSAGGLSVTAAPIQDGVRLIGGAGGTSSFFASIAPAALSTSVTWTLPSRSDTFAGLGAQTFTAPQTIATAAGVNAIRLGPDINTALSLTATATIDSTGGIPLVLADFRNANAGPAPIFYKAHGLTAAGRTATQAGDQILFMMGSGRGATTDLYNKGGFFLSAPTAWSDTNAETRLDFSTTPNGSVTRATRLSIIGSGEVSIGGVDPVTGNGALQVYGSQTIDLGSGALPAAVGASVLRISGADAQPNRVEFLAFGGGVPVNFRGRASRGTRASPTAVAGDDPFMVFTANGYDGSAWQDNSGYWCILADGTWSGANRGTYFTFRGTPNGSTTNTEWMRLQNTSLGIGIAPTTSNGLLQLANGTTKANGIAFGTDTFLYRIGAGALELGSATNPYFMVNSSGGARVFLAAQGTQCVLSTDTNHPLLLKTSNVTALTLDTSQNATFAGKIKANGAAASSTLTGNTVAQVITWLQTVFQ